MKPPRRPHLIGMEKFHAALKLQDCEALEALLDDPAFLPTLEAQARADAKAQRREDGKIHAPQAKGPLAWAAFHDWPEGVDALAFAGADLELADSHGYTPLFKAVEAGSALCVAKLIELGADAGALNHQGETAMHIAALLGQLDIVRIVAGAKPWTDSLNHAGYSCVCAAATLDSPECMALLASLGFPIDAPNGWGGRPLAIALNSGAEACASWLLSKKADPNQRSEGNGRLTPLGIALGRNLEGIAMELIHAGADIHAETETMPSPLAMARAAPTREASAAVLRWADAQQLRAEISQSAAEPAEPPRRFGGSL